jgi:hypothetical protein
MSNSPTPIGPGHSIIGSLATGILGLFFAVFALFRGEISAAGICLIAAALAFGLLANAVYRR